MVQILVKVEVSSGTVKIEQRPLYAVFGP